MVLIVSALVVSRRATRALAAELALGRNTVVRVYDQLIVEGILQPLLIRLPGEHWRLASGWKSLVFYNKTKEQ